MEYGRGKFTYERIVNSQKNLLTIGSEGVRIFAIRIMTGFDEDGRRECLQRAGVCCEPAAGTSNAHRFRAEGPNRETISRRLPSARVKG